MLDFITKLVEGLEQGGGAGSILPFAVILWCGALYLVYLVITKVIFPLCSFLQEINVKKTTSWNAMNISVIILFFLNGVFSLYLIFTLSDSTRIVKESDVIVEKAEKLFQKIMEREKRTKEFMNKVDERRKASKELLNKIEETNEKSEELLKATKELHKKAKEKYKIGIETYERGLEVKKEALELLDEAKERHEKLENKH